VIYLAFLGEAKRKIKISYLKKCNLNLENKKQNDGYVIEIRNLDTY
jgi:hypothetical protein